MPNSEAHENFRSSPDKDRGPMLQHLQAREFQQCLVGLLPLPRRVFPLTESGRSKGGVPTRFRKGRAGVAQTAGAAAQAALP